MYDRDHYFEVGTCRVDENGRLVTDIYHTTESTYDAAVRQFESIVKSVKEHSRLTHREIAGVGVTAYINEFKINRAEGTGTVDTIRREAI